MSIDINGNLMKMQGVDNKERKELLKLFRLKLSFVDNNIFNQNKFKA